jgi:TonB family protein
MFFTNAAAQTDAPNDPKIISGGVLNGKATKLVKPPYPKEAKEARADGPVLIQVTVDEEGNVISASAVNGHPLLLAVSEQAARASKFAPTKLQDQPVRVRGVIVYNFVNSKSFVQIGYELALAEKTSTPEVFPTASIVGNLPRDWKEEIADIYKLSSYSTEKLAENKKNDAAPQASVKPNEAVNEGRILKSSSTGAVDTYTFTLSNQSPEAVEILKNLQIKIEKRLSADEKRRWYFQIGRMLGSIAAESHDSEKLRSHLLDFNRLLKDAPSDMPESEIKKLREIAEFSQSDTLDTPRKNKLLALVKSLR